MMMRLQTGFAYWSPHMLMALHCVQPPSIRRMQLQSAKVWAGSVAHRNGNSPCILEWLWDDGHHVLASSSHGLAWQSYCAPYLAPNCQAGKGLCSCREQSLLRCFHTDTGWWHGIPASPSEPNPDNVPQRTLTRDIWELDNDKLWEVLEAIRYKMDRRKGGTP